MLAYHLENYSSQAVRNKDNRTFQSLGYYLVKEQRGNFVLDISTLDILLSS